MAGLVLAALAVIPSHARAQDETATRAGEPEASPDRPVKRLALVGGTVLTVSGPRLKPGDVLIENGKIAAVGRNLHLPEGTAVLDVSGRTVFPGLIDAGSTLGLPEKDAATGQAGLSVKDGLDPFDPDLERVLAAGVTTVLVTPKLRSASTGTFASVIKIRPGADPAAMILVDVAAVRAAIGVSNGTTSDTLTRWRSYQSLERTLEGIKSYTESLDRYRKSLEKWKNDLRDWRKKVGIPVEDDGKAGAKGKDGKKRDKKKAGAKPASEKPSKKNKRVPRRPKKPREPRPDPVKQALADALDRKIPLRIEAHRAVDIRRALALARDHDFRLVLEGATEAAAVADEIKKAGASVVLGPLVLCDMRRLEYAKFDPASVAVLARREIPIALASASIRPLSGRFLPLIAAATSGHGLGRDRALRAVTLDAAKVLGVEKRLGSIEIGKDADLVIADRHPLDTECKVETVLIEGEVVHGIARPSAGPPREGEKR